MTKLKLIITASLAFALAQAASALFVQGDIGFTAGSWSGSHVGTPDSEFESITISDAETDGMATGDYAIVPNGVSATFSTLDLTASSGPIWSFDYGGKTYSFESTSYDVLLNFDDATDGFFVLGEGYASISNTDLDPGWGTFSVSGNSNGQSFTFSASTSVPDAGATAMLLGLGLIGLGAAARRFKKQ